MPSESPPKFFEEEEMTRVWDEAMRDLAERGVDTDEAMRRACRVLEAAERGELPELLPIDDPPDWPMLQALPKPELIVLAMPFPFLIVHYRCDALFEGDDRYPPRLIFVHRDAIGRVIMSDQWLTIIHTKARA